MKLAKYFNGLLGQRLIIPGLLVLTLVLAAMFGAWWQAQKQSGHWQLVLSDQSTQQVHAVRRGERVQQNLAQELGHLQARITQLENISQDLALRLGVGNSAMAWQPDQAGSGYDLSTAAALLRHRLARQENVLGHLAAAWRQQLALQQALPTSQPLRKPLRSSAFGWRHNPLGASYRMHNGLDFAAPLGTPIKAASGGLVLRAGWRGGYGKSIELFHGHGLASHYAHAARLLVRAGDIVRTGQTIALVGSSGHSTGPHLHFEVRLAGYVLDPGMFLATAPLHAGR